MNYTFIILGVILVIVLYVLYKALLAPTSVVSSQTYLQSKPSPVDLKTITTAPGINCAYAVWIYANNLSAADDLIFKIPTAKNSEFSNLELKLSSSAVLSAKIKKNNDEAPTIEITKNFPLQRWEHIIINVDNNLVELYLDGKLLRSVKSKSPIPTPTVDSVLSFGKGDMYIAKFNRNLFTIDQTTAFNNYIGGNNGLRLTNYTISFDFLKNSKTAYNYQLL
jgi:hypothetical protein